MKHVFTLLAAVVALSLAGCESSGYSKGSAATPLIVKILEQLGF